MSLNDYEGFKVVWRQRSDGWWEVEMTHLVKRRSGSIARQTRKECEQEMPFLALRLTDPDRYFATLGER